MLIESTYGDRRHPAVDAEAELAAPINRAVERGGAVVVPAFAVGRAQLLLHLIARLKARRVIADVPVYLNSPMATDATRLYHSYHDEHRLSPEECTAMFTAARFVNTVEDSKRLNTLTGPMIIISASGMATGGRVLHHLKAFAPDARNLILFSGYQAAGTRGAAFVGGADTGKIHGERVFITHGEPAAADALRQQLRRELVIDEVTVAEHGETVTRESKGGAARVYAQG